MSDEFKILAWNVHNGSGEAREVAEAALRMMKETGAKAAVLNEAKALIPHLHTWAKRTGGTCLAEDPKPGNPAVVEEYGSTVVLLAPGVKQARSWVVVNTLQWIVRQYNRKHQPRRNWRVTLVDEAIKGFGGDHWPPGGPDSVNGPAWKECRDAAASWLRRTGLGARVIVGDLNGKMPDLVDLVRDVGGDMAGHNVDWCLVSGGKVRSKVLKSDLSDHKPVLYTVTAAA